MNHYSKKESKTSLFSLGKEEATSSNLVIGSNNSKASHYLKVLTSRAV